MKRFNSPIFGSLVILSSACGQPLDPAPDPPGADAAVEETPARYGLVTVDRDITADEHAEILDTLWSQDARVFLSLPGNVFITNPLPEGFAPDKQIDPAARAFGYTNGDWHDGREPSYDNYDVLVDSSRVVAPDFNNRALSIGVYLEVLEPVEPAAHVLEPGFLGRDAFTPAEMATDALEHLRAELLRTTDADEVARIEHEIAATEHSMVTLEAISAGPSAPASDGLKWYPNLGGAADQDKFGRGAWNVTLFFPESIGTLVAAGYENWTSSEGSSQFSAFSGALLELARVSPPSYYLSFQLAWYSVGNSVNSITHEPTGTIGNLYTHESAWIGQLMNNVNAPGGWFCNYQCKSNNMEDWLADLYNKDHSTIVYVARDQVAPYATREDINGNSTSALTAWPHAQYGSYAVTNSCVAKPDCWVTSNQGTFVHELLHTMWANDEYVETGCNAFTNRSRDRGTQAGAPGGYTNGNTVDCSYYGGTQNCIMKGSGSGISAGGYLFRSLCWHTRAQIGWGDTDVIRADLTGLNSHWGHNYWDFNPSLRIKVAGTHYYMPVGLSAYGYEPTGTRYIYGRRCMQHTSGAQYTQVGAYSSCSSDAGVSGYVNGSPWDIAGGGQTGYSRDIAIYYSPWTSGCGNGSCEAGETASSCPQDCWCGNGACDPGETVSGCPGDCGYCGDGYCDESEIAICPDDCCEDEWCLF